MELFKKSPDKQLAAARASRDDLTARLAKAEAAVTAKRIAAKELAKSGGEDTALDKAEAALRISQDRVQTLAIALAETNTEVLRFEAEVADTADKALRAKTAQEVESLAVEIADSHTAVSAALKHHSELHGRAALIVPEARGIENTAAGFAVELQPADNVVIRDLRNHAKAVLSGGAPASLPRPGPKPLPAPQPATVAGVFTADTIRWTDANGDLMTEHRWWETYLPPAIADHAIAIGAAVPFGHDLHRKQKGWGKNTAKPKPEDCRFNLDDPDVPIDAAPIADKAKPSASVHPLQPPEVRSAFEKPVIGPKVDFKVPRGEPSLANATRNLDKDHKT